MLGQKTAVTHTGKQMSAPLILYRAVAGSHAYGLSEPTSDRDYEGVYFPTDSQLLGCRAVQKAKSEKVKGDDVTYYSLHQFGLLLAQGNFKALELLYIPNELVEYRNNAFIPFIQARDSFLSNRIIAPLLGFAQSNAKHLDNKPNAPRRRKLYDAYGYDTKYLMQSVRILMVGEHYLNTGEFKIDWSDKRDYLLGIKNGSMGRDEGLELLNRMSSKIIEAVPKEEVVIKGFKEGMYGREHFKLADKLTIEISKNILFGEQQ